MVLSISGTTGTIVWCGKTWNLPSDSGKKQEVCPTYYNSAKDGKTWNCNSINRQLVMAAVYDDPAFVGNRLIIGTGNGWYNSSHGTGWYGTNVTNLNSIIKYSPYPATYYPDLASGVNENTVILGSITYTWSKGTNW